MFISHRLLLITLLLAISGALFSQNKQQLLEITRTVNEIRYNLGSYPYSTKINTDSAQKYIYKKGGEIKLILASCIENQIQKTVRWYYDKGKLIYAEQYWRKQDNSIYYETRGPNPKEWLQHEQYLQQKEAGVPDSVITMSFVEARPKKEYSELIDHQQFYLRQGRLIAWFHNDERVPEQSPEFKDLDATLGAYGRQLKNE